METVAIQVKDLIAAADEKTHREIVEDCRQLLHSIERPEDTAHRLAFEYYQVAVARIAQRSNLVDVLVRNGQQPMMVSEIAKKAGMSELVADQVSDESFVASDKTEALCKPVLRGAVGCGIDFLSIAATALPAYLEQNNWQNPEGSQDCPFTVLSTHGTTLYQYMADNPVVLDDFNTWMEHQRLDPKTWLDSYPLDLTKASSDVFFVDIGGGRGHMCTDLVERNPQMSGRVILQDLQDVIDNSPPNQKFESMVHDYFTDQPIEGAKYYYFRNIMHNLNDEDCCKVLRLTKAAMTIESKILVDDIVMPIRGAHWRTVTLDFVMMAALGAIERTEKQWNALFDKVGLKAKIFTYDDLQGDSVLELVPM